MIQGLDYFVVRYLYRSIRIRSTLLGNKMNNFSFLIMVILFIEF